MKNFISRIQDGYIHRSDEFDEVFYGYCTFIEKEPDIRILNKKIKRISNDVLSYRVLNHWEKMKLINAERIENKGWRKFSIVDLVWIQIMIELRKFGVSLENLLKIKKDLSRYDINKTKEELLLLEFYIVQAFISKSPIYIIVTSKFYIDIASDKEVEISEQLGLLGNYISINLNNMIRKMFPNYDMEFSIKEKLSDSEFELLLAIRTGEFKEINIKMKNGEIIKIDKTMDIYETNISKILKSSNYSDINIVTENGKIVHITQKIKTKV